MSFGSTVSWHKTSQILAVRDEHNARQYSRFLWRLDDSVFGKWCARKRRRYCVV